MLTPLPSQDWNYETAAHLLNRAAFGGIPGNSSDAGKRSRRCGARSHPDQRRGERSASPAWAQPRNIRDTPNADAGAEGRAGEIPGKTARVPQDGGRKYSRSAALVAGTHDDDARAVARKDDALLARPFRDQRAESERRLLDVAAKRHAAPERARKLRRANEENLARSGDDDFLDLQQSRKEHPNENWARELMELFTVGIGNYTEKDIRESARAFTGYRIDLTNQQFRFARFQHDATTKTFLERTGPFDGDDVIDALVHQPACASFIGRKIWRYFVEDDPSPEIVATVAERIRAHKYEIRPLLR